MAEIQVAFIGCGSLASRIHHRCVAELPEARIVAFCDLDKTRCTAAVEAHSGKAYSDYREMLDREAIDAVYVIMPPQWLDPIVRDCLARGKHVFTEKPPGVSAAQTRAWAELAAECGVRTMVGFNRRFSRVLVEAKVRVERRGPVTQAVAEFHKHEPRRDYYGLNQLVTDVIHALDWLRWVGGEVREVTSYVDTFTSDQDNTYNALMRFDEGGVGLISANRASGSRYERHELHGNGIAAYARAPEVVEIHMHGREKPEILHGADLAGSGDRSKTYGYFDEHHHFLDCLLNTREPLTSFADAVGSMELVDRIYAGREP